MTTPPVEAMTQAETAHLAAVRNLLRTGECRIELGFAFGVGGTYATAHLFRRGDRGRWEKVGPMLLPPEGGGRPELLDIIAALSRDEP